MMTNDIINTMDTRSLLFILFLLDEFFDFMNILMPYNFDISLLKFLLLPYSARDMAWKGDYRRR